MPADNPPSRGRAAAVAVAAGIFLSRIAGLVRERLFAHYLGNSLEAGAFKAALRIPNLLQNLLGEGALSASFIPVYSRLLGAKQDERAEELASTVGSILILGTMILTALGVLLAGPLTSLVAPGFADSAKVLTTNLVRIIFAGVGLLVVSAYCLGVLNSHRKFFISYVAPVVWNATQIAALVFFGKKLLAGERATLVIDLAWATLIGSALQLAVQLPPTLALLRKVRPSLRLSAEVREVLRNFGPAVTARGVVQISAFLDQAFVSFLPEGMTSAMMYAQQIYLLPISLFGMSISASELPELSRSIGESGKPSEEQAKKVRERLTNALSRMTFFVVPAAVAFIALGNLCVGALFQTGAFKQSDTVTVWMILAGASIALVAATRARLYSSTLYALSDTRTPLRFATIRVLTGASLGLLLAYPVRQRLGLDARYGAAALTFASACAGWVEYLLLRRAVGQRVGQARGTLRARVAPFGAALLAAGVAWLVAEELAREVVYIATLVPLGVYGLLYLGFARVLGVAEANALIARIYARLRKRPNLG